MESESLNVTGPDGKQVTVPFSTHHTVVLGSGAAGLNAAADARTVCARHVLSVGGESPLRAAMSGTASPGKGVHREVESEGSRRAKLRPDEQKPDIRPARRGNPARDGDAQYSSGRAGR